MYPRTARWPDSPILFDGNTITVASVLTRAISYFLALAGDLAATPLCARRGEEVSSTWTMAVEGRTLRSADNNCQRNVARKSKGEQVRLIMRVSRASLWRLVYSTNGASLSRQVPARPLACMQHSIESDMSSAYDVVSVNEGHGGFIFLVTLTLMNVHHGTEYNIVQRIDTVCQTFR